MEKEELFQELKDKQKQLDKCLVIAKKAVDFDSRDDNLGSVVGVFGLIGLVCGWYFAAWYWGLALALILGLSIQFAIAPWQQDLAEELFKQLRPSLKKFVADEGALGLKAIMIWQKYSPLSSDYNDHMAKFVEDFKGSNKELIPALEQLDGQLDGFDDAQFEIERMQSQLENMTSSLQEMSGEQQETNEINEKSPLKQLPPTKQEVPSAPVHKKKEVKKDKPKIHKSFYQRCRLDMNSKDIIIPPMEAGVLRYTMPPSSQWFDSHDIGSGMVFAMTKTHFVMSLLEDRCWRVGFDCVESFSFRPNERRQMDVKFHVGLDHSYAYCSCRRTAGFEFWVGWHEWQSNPEEYIPLAQKYVNEADPPSCPACSSKKLVIGTEEAITGMFKSGMIPNKKATCTNCGANMMYALSVGAWMASDDEDLKKCNPPLKTDLNGLIGQTWQLLAKAEPMIHTTRLMATEAQVKQKEFKEKHLDNFTLGITWDSITMTHKQRRRRINYDKAKVARANLEYVEGVNALLFNFANVLPRVFDCLKEHVNEMLPGRLDVENQTFDELIGAIEDGAAKEAIILMKRTHKAIMAISGFVYSLS